MLTSLPILEARCPLRCESYPASNLTTSLPWKTDIPTQRTTLILRVRPHSDVYRIDTTLIGATIVEAHEGVDPDAPPAWPPVDEGAAGFAKPGIPRTELFSMFRYKSLLAANPCATPSVAVTLMPRREAADGTDVRCLSLTSGLLQLTLLCAWEPMQCLGIESITVYGRYNTAPPLPSTSVVAAPPRVAHDAAPLPSTRGAAAPPQKRGRSDTDALSPSVAPAVSAYDAAAPMLAAARPPAARPPAAMETAAPVIAHSLPLHAHAAVDRPHRADAASPPSPAGASAVDPKPLLGCIVVLSGFVNPLRAELRDKALSLGANVQNDWTAHSTHLVAAMLNTPKVAATRASGHGWIVSKEWVLHAFLAKARPKEVTYRLAGDTAVSVDAPAAAAAAAPPPPGGGGGGAFRLVM
jgi:hypothetical protein